MTTLKACPFCGEHKTRLQSRVLSTPIRVACENCGVEGPRFALSNPSRITPWDTSSEAEQAATRHWNNRASAQRTSKRIKKATDLPTS